MRFQCPFCSYNIRGITASMLGCSINCPDCGQLIHIKDDPFQSGRILGDFIINRKLGAGSIGTVYLAEQRSLYRKVALKVLSKEYSTRVGIEAFLKEARAVAKLSHPNLVQAFGVGEEDGVCFLAMNFIDGITIKQKIDREKKIKVDEALHIVQQVAEGLYYAWDEAHLIHRDVKPENIMITKEGAVKLTDLGLAVNQTEFNLQQEREISGSPSYMSPEQFTGEELDFRCDIYALGVTLYEMIAGVLPFDGATLKTVARQHFYEPPKPLNKVNPAIPSKVCALVKKMMEKDPENRYQNMESLIHAIWTVRQTTAPNKDLIPSVHTVSLKHLDYDLQKMSQERKKQITTTETKEKRKNAVFYNIFYVTTPILFVAFFAYYILQDRPNQRQRENAIKINSLGSLINRNNSDIRILEEKLDVLKSSIQLGNNDYDKILNWKLQYYKEKIENLKLSKEINQLKTLYDKTEQESHYKLSKLIKQNKDTELELQRREKILAEKEKVIRNFMKEKKALDKKAGEQENLSRKLQEIKKEYTYFLKDVLRIRLYTLLRKARIQEADAFINIKEKEHSGLDAFFEFYRKVVSDLKSFYSAVISSGTKYAGINAGKFGRIRNIIRTTVFLVDENGNEIQLPLNALPLSALREIAEKAFPDMKQSRIVRYCIFLSDSIGQSYILLPEDNEINKVAEAVAEYKLNKIRIYSLLDKKKAKDDAKLFLKEFSDFPITMEKYKSELKKLFER